MVTHFVTSVVAIVRAKIDTNLAVHHFGTHPSTLVVGKYHNRQGTPATSRPLHKLRGSLPATSDIFSVNTKYDGPVVEPFQRRISKKPHVFICTEMNKIIYSVVSYDNSAPLCISKFKFFDT